MPKPENIKLKTNNKHRKDNGIIPFFICIICNKKFSLIKNLNRHKKEQHEKRNFKTCPYCFKEVPRFKEHLQRCKRCIYNNIISLFQDSNNNNSKLEKEKFLINDSIFNHSKYKAFQVKIGEGTFGNVFYGINLENSNPFAIKIFKDRKKENHSSFQKELNFIQEFRNEKFFPKLFYSEYSNSNKIIIQSLHGPNLKKLAYLSGGKFPLYSILSIGIELLKRVEIIHSHGIIHCDIKPSNILYGNFTDNNILEKDSLFLVDYGLSKKYLNNNNKHYEYLENQKVGGTYEFLSRHALNCERLSRRDDIESIFYTLVYLFKGELPWSKFAKKYSGKEEFMKIRDFNFNYNIKTLIEGLPEVFEFIYRNIEFLNFDEKPPYEYFITLLEKEKIKILKKNNINSKYKYIWVEEIKEALDIKYKNNEAIINKIQETFFSLDKDVIKEYFSDIQKENINLIFK